MDEAPRDLPGEALMTTSDSDEDRPAHTPPYHGRRDAHTHAHALAGAGAHVHAPYPGMSARRLGRKGSVHAHAHAHRPRSMRVPSSPMMAALPPNAANLPSAPASPPTPAPSPSPHRRPADWSTVEEEVEEEELVMRECRAAFADASRAARERMLAEILSLCNSRDLTFVHDFVCPRLKRDPFASLPDELSLRILSFIDHPRTLARASQVSRRWHDLVNDDMAWKSLCEKHAYRRMSNDSDGEARSTRPLSLYIPPFQRSSKQVGQPGHPARHSSSTTSFPFPNVNSLFRVSSSSAPDLLMGQALDGTSERRAGANKRPLNQTSYRTQFKRRYMVETAWRSGGVMHARQITPDQGIVTSLHLTDKYIAVGIDNSKIHIFDTDGGNQKTLHGHMMGVWAMVPWGDTLVSGGCDRDVRVWNMATGQSVHVLRGHSSTVRCLRMSDANTAITGSRDASLRIWDLAKGVCKHVLIGHLASVRCVEVHGDMIASGSYDTTAKIWSISEGKCLRTLQGHFSQIYAIAFDGRRVATGSLDTSVRIWNPLDGHCLAVLSGHTSLVGQLQMRGDTLVTGGSDGSVRVWSLQDYRTVHRLAAHDNSVTSLQFNDSRIISGGSDGRLKVWDLKTGMLVRELGDPADAVWRVVFEEEKAIVIASRNSRTILEVWSFAPPGELNSRPLERSTSVFSPPRFEDHSLGSSTRPSTSPTVVADDDVDMTDDLSSTGASTSLRKSTRRFFQPPA